MLLAMPIPHNPLRGDPAFLSIIPDEPFAPPRRYGNGIYYYRPDVLREWSLLVHDVRRALPLIGLPEGRYVFRGDPATIELDDWGDVQLVADTRGPRVIIRICTPRLAGDAVWFRSTNLGETLNGVMYGIMKMGEMAGRLKPTNDVLLQRWPQLHTTTYIDDKRMALALADVTSPNPRWMRRGPMTAYTVRAIIRLGLLFPFRSC